MLKPSDDLLTYIRNLSVLRIIRSIWSDYGPWPIHIVIISEYVRKACKDVVQSWPGISWNTPLVQVRSATRESTRH